MDTLREVFTTTKQEHLRPANTSGIQKKQRRFSPTGQLQRGVEKTWQRTNVYQNRKGNHLDKHFLSQLKLNFIHQFFFFFLVGTPSRCRQMSYTAPAPIHPQKLSNCAKHKLGVNIIKLVFFDSKNTQYSGISIMNEHVFMVRTNKELYEKIRRLAYHSDTSRSKVIRTLLASQKEDQQLRVLLS